MSNIAAIIVLYHPPLDGLRKTIDAVSPQVETIYLIDNSIDRSNEKNIYSLLKDNCSILSQNGNSGVSAAINRGIRAAKTDGAEYVLLLDQDSVPDPNMIKILYKLLCAKDVCDSRIGAIGPSYYDQNGQEQPPFVIQENFRIKRIGGEGKNIVFLDHLITSGSLIPMEVIETVGLMNEELFIDYIDTDWCLRAKQQGFAIAGAPFAHMEHSLGDETKIFFGQNITIRSPQRCYYTIRNGIWLLKQSYVPWGWFFADVIRLSQIFLVFTFFAGSRIHNFTMMIKAIVDGLFSRLGPLQDDQENQ